MASVRIGNEIACLRHLPTDVRCLGAFVGPVAAEKGGPFGHATSTGGSSCGAAGPESAARNASDRSPDTS